MSTHRVKSWTFLYDAVKAGYKTADFRDMRERDYKVGDTLVLCRFDQTTGKFTGEELPCLITHMINRNTPCAMSSCALDKDYVVLSIRIIE